MEALTISEATPQGMLAQRAAAEAKTETKTLSSVVREDSSVLLKQVPELLEHNPLAEKVLFALSPDGRLKIVKPFVVTVQRTEGVVTAWVEEMNEFGYGSNSGEAFHDLGKTLAELYFSLKETADRLSPDLHSVWLRLTEHIQPRQA